MMSVMVPENERLVLDGIVFARMQSSILLFVFHRRPEARARGEVVPNGETVAVTETDQYGLYFFREVYPAVYTLKATAPSEVKPTQKRTDIDLIDSSLNETEEETAWTDEFAVASDSTDFNLDLGYALRRAGDYPPGYGEQETMDWSRAYDNVTLK